MKKVKEFILDVGKPVYGGKNLASAKDKDKLFIIQKALEGEKVKARLRRSKKSYYEADILEIIEPSTYRIIAKCKYYGFCGGCKLQDVNYDYQTEIKGKVIEDCINHIGKDNNFEFMGVVPSDTIEGYRNKMEFTFSKKRYYWNDQEIKDDADDFNLGFHAPKVYEKVIDIEECLLQSKLLNDIYGTLRELLKNSQLEAYDIKNHQGYLRHLVLRETVNQEVMINFITKTEQPHKLQHIVQSITDIYPQVQMVVNTINKGKAAVAFGEKEILLFGKSKLVDNIKNLQFNISSNSFFQVNPYQVEKLYDLILEFGNFKKQETILDLYCGVGTISSYIASNVKLVIGYEIVDNAIKDARENTTINSIDNCEFHCSDLMTLAKENSFISKDIKTLVIDPPRDGMHPKVVKQINSSDVNKIIYVSCNPSTFARDLLLLKNGGFKLIKVKGVDMFPHTYHVEIVALISR